MRPLKEDTELKLYKWEDPEGKYAYWHSSAHLMAEALQSLYPGVKFGIGPAIENGFYYDIDLGEGVQLRDADLAAVEAKMAEFAARKEPIIRRDITKAEVTKFFEEKGDEYKLELIADLPDGSITTYSQGDFTDLCRGPHVPNTGYIKAIKLLSVAGAYWRGDEKRKQLTRLYGITFPKKKMLDEYLTMLEEAKKRDHRKIGKELGLFSFSQNVGSGLPLWLLAVRSSACVWRTSSSRSRSSSAISRSSPHISARSSSTSPPVTGLSTVRTPSALSPRLRRVKSLCSSL